MSALQTIKSAITISGVVICHVTFAQPQIIPKWEAGIYGGAWLYQGDLTPQRIGSLKTITPGFGIQGTRILSPAFSAMLSFSIAKLRGDESLYSAPAYRQQRNFAFSTPVKELGMVLLYNIRRSNYQERKLEPYLFAGGSFSFTNIKRDYSRLNNDVFDESSEVRTGLAQDLQKKPPRVIPAIPLGLLLKYNITERFAITATSTYRLMYTDYLDGFSKAASPKYNDHYASQTVGVVYKFGQKPGAYFQCPSY